jgi:hypothetical protein
VATAAAAWSNAFIPIYGQIKLVDKVRDLVKLVNDAHKVITMFWSALVLIKDGIVMVAHSFDVDALPPAPVDAVTRHFDEERIVEARRDLRDTMAHARAALDRVRAEPVLTPQERRRLHADALAGPLGPDMQRLARHVEAGGTSWGEVFDGSSPYAGLAAAHLDRMIDAHADRVRDALRADPDFDPSAPHEGV